MFPSNRFIRPIAKFFAAVVSVLLLISALASPPGVVLDDTHAAVRAVKAVQGQVTPDLMQQPEILGTAVGIGTGDVPALTVYVDQDAVNVGEVIRNLPREFRGVRVRPADGRNQAMAHTAKQTPPIQVGTSDGWVFDRANGYAAAAPWGAGANWQHAIHFEQLSRA
jgi:hypothetical protein